MQPIDTFLNRILYGDCIDVLRRIPTASVDFVLTDPPYIVRYASRDGRTYAGDDTTRWLTPAFAEVSRVLKPGRFCVSFYGWSKVHHFMAAWRAAGLVPVSHFVFVKDYASKTGMTRACHESAYLLAKGQPRRPRVILPDVLEWRYSGNALHPTQKPVMALTPLVLAYSAAGDIVLDPFAGSGTTAVAARALNRKYIGIEKVWRYCRIARERLKAARTE